MISRHLLIGAALSAALPLRAQTVRGTVRDSASALPLPGAVVGLTDAGGTSVGRVVTNERGQFRLSRPSSATRLRVVRIGFRPVELSLRGAGDETIDIRMARLPQLLEAVRVAGNANCPKRGDANAAFALWEQARAGLLATVVARETNPPKVVRLGFERSMYGSTDRIEEQSVRIDSAEVPKSFTAVLSAEDFIKYGFVKDSAGKQIFYGPDADILLDPAFTGGYCFQLRDRDNTRPTQVGLGFNAPDRKSGRIDIDGTLWVDTAARAIKDVEFRYLRLGAEYNRFRPGGHVWFETMPNGQVLIDRWSMRLIGASAETTWVGSSMPSIRSYLYAREAGGELVSAQWSDSTLWHASLGTLYVHAVNADGLPATGFVMRLDNTDYIASPNEHGDLQIRDLLPGPYRAVIVDTVLAPLGLTMPTSLKFVAERDSISSHRMLVPNTADYIRRDCNKSMSLSDGGPLLAIRAVTADGRSVRNANWQILRNFGIGWQLVAQKQRTDADGLLRHCLALRPGDDIEIRVWRDGEGQTVVRHRMRNSVDVLRVIVPDPKR